MATFTLGVWRPIRYGRALYYINHRTNSEGEYSIDSSPYDKLYEQIFVWSPEEDVWGSIQNEELRNQIRGRFIDTFRYDVEPADRSIEALSKFVLWLDELIKNPEVIYPISTSTPVTNGPTVGTCIRTISTIALLRHLDWIVESFKSIPNISIVVR